MLLDVRVQVCTPFAARNISPASFVSTQTEQSIAPWRLVGIKHLLRPCVCVISCIYPANGGISYMTSINPTLVRHSPAKLPDSLLS